MPPGVLRWPVCIAMVATPCILLSMRLKRKKKLQLRTYQFAE
jgi:hypothetical protein